MRSAHVSIEPAALSQLLFVDGQSIHLTPRDVQRAFARGAPSEDGTRSTVALKVFEGTCLLIGMWLGANYHVELIDTSGRGWFARYVYFPDVG